MARDERGGVQGFYVAIVAAKVHKNLMAKDPLIASWAKDLPRAEDRPLLSGYVARWIAIREKGHPRARRPAGSTKNELIWNCVRSCAGSIPATAMRISTCARSRNWDCGWRMRAGR